MLDRPSGRGNGRRASLLLLPGLLAAACTIITEFSSDRVLELSEERCSDGVDNDGNGRTDCADDSCKHFDFCSETVEARCADGVDNDADGLVDCQDPGCCGFSFCTGEPACGERSQAACSDRLDNDSNGLTDCGDFSCTVAECCRRLIPLLADSFLAGAGSCLPPSCDLLQEACCDRTATPCNGFDPGRWLAWGNPPPRITSQRAFSPNQPCVACGASGLISVADFSFAPDLVLQLELDSQKDPSALLEAGFVDRAIIPTSEAPCAGLVAPFPLLAGLRLRGGQLEAVVGGLTRSSLVVDSKRSHRVSLTLSRRGTLRFTVNDQVFHESPIQLDLPYRPVHLLLQGHTTAGTIDEVLVASRNGCPDWAGWVAGPHGPGPVLRPDQKGERFDSSAISDPSVLMSGSTLHLFYTGTTASPPGTRRLGMASSLDGGQTWALPEGPLAIDGEAAADEVSLSDPVVIRHGESLLLAYVRRDLAGSAIMLARKAIGDAVWQRQGTAVGRGAAGEWDSLEVDAPALLYFRNRFHLWYIGRGPGRSPSLGLATAGAPLSFTKEPSNPIFLPGIGTHDDRGITDPWIQQIDGVLQLWYVGLTWGGQSQINLAASEDGHNWVRFPDNPAIRAGQPDLFGGAEVRGPTLLDTPGRLQLWYSGSDPAVPPSVGHALSLPRPR